MRYRLIFYFLCLFFIQGALTAENGSQLWLRFNDVNSKQASIISKRKTPSVKIAISELEKNWGGQSVELSFNKKLRGIKDGYIIKGDKNKIIISASTDAGLLYGTYHLLRLQQIGRTTDQLNIEEKPSYDIRILNHWDNLDGTIERGYAGYSLWKWDELPHTLSPRYKEYARANASIGINGTVLNNVNASPKILSSEYITKVKSLADIFRPYGIRVYLSVNFASPKVLGGLANSDPLNKDVQRWWKDKVNDVYKQIPDFGGFLVKANSEGQAGPQDYGRTHADGANMLADVLKPHGGIVMWRAFVYNPTSEDRAKQAFQEFMPLDGQFRENVIIQIKNGPVDFQPREPFSPLFGALQDTPEMIEFQITQEYLGFSNHLVYLAPLFEETLKSDTYANGEGSTIAKITDGTLRKHKFTAISAVANIGENVNWCGHHFAQSNWYAFGRLAWNHELQSEQIADEWIKMTFTNSNEFVEPIKKLMMSSRETCVDYMMPLGLHHIFAFTHHYGPEPWGDMPGGRPDWMPWYYHNANETGLGFDRTTSGSNAVSQYFPPLDQTFNDISLCPENLILWFHHVSWKHKMKSGRILWDELCYHYDRGVQQVREYQKVWDKVGAKIDSQRFKEVQSKLKIQARDAVWWRDACLLYFQTFSKMPIPYELERPIHDLDELKEIQLDMKHHN